MDYMHQATILCLNSTLQGQHIQHESKCVSNLRVARQMPTTVAARLHVTPNTSKGDAVATDTVAAPDGWAAKASSSNE